MSLWVLGRLKDGRSMLVHALLSIVLGPGQAVVRLSGLRIDAWLWLGGTRSNACIGRRVGDCLLLRRLLGWRLLLRRLLDWLNGRLAIELGIICSPGSSIRITS